MSNFPNDDFEAEPVFHARPPSPSLAQEVALVWSYASPPLPHARERVLPVAGAQLIINLRENAFTIFAGDDGTRPERRSGALFVGPRTSYSVIETHQHVEYVGVVFRPGGAGAFVSGPLRDLCNEELDAETIWGSIANEWRDRLLATRSIPRRLDRLERMIAATRICGYKRHPAVGWALEKLSEPDAAPLSAIVDQVGYSSRHFINLFASEVGLAPKQFQRLQRFQRMASSLHSRRIDCLATASLDCGYYDQSHFCHDFRRFAGVSATSYLERRTQHHNHLREV